MTEPLRRRVRLLVVDDDPAYRTIVERLLRRSGWADYHIESAPDYAAATACDTLAFDVVLLDYQLGDRNGLDVLAIWRKEGADVPVIMLTAAGGEAVDLSAAAAGASEYLDKTDLEPRTLERAIRYAMAAHQSLRDIREMARAESALARAAATLLDCVDDSGFAERVLRSAIEEFGADGGSVFELLPDRQLKRLACLPSPPAPGVAASTADFPLAIGDSTLGVLQLSSGASNFFTASRSAMLTTFAHMAALTLRGIRLQEQLRQSQKLEAIGRLAGGIAHDFNNILTVIIGHAALLKEAPLDPDAHESAAEIFTGGERAAALTRQLLAFARGQILRPEPLDLNATVRSLGSLLQRLITEDVDIETHLARDPTCVLADRGQVEQVIVNLAVNARDAMPEGGRLSIGTDIVRLATPVLTHESVLEAGDYARLTVSDTGTGMPATTLGRVFEPFFTTKPQGKGTGLGLSTVLGIVQQSGGRITVESEEGKGTVFRVYFPLLASAGQSLIADP